MRLHFEIHGCALNRGEGRELEEEAAARGHAIVAGAADADLTVLVTCTVVQSTENRMVARLRTLRKAGRRVAVTGCLAWAQAELVRKVFPEALPVPQRGGSSLLETLGEPGPGAVHHRPRERAVDLAVDVPIADGCRGRCTYCITRLARCALLSRPVEDVLARTRTAVERGCREVRLAAQDSGLYGTDIGAGLPGLLEQICRLPGDFRVRVGMMNPESLPPIMNRLMEAFQNPKLFKFLHLPVQSGDDRVLASMGRNYRAADFPGLVRRFREAFPLGLLATDIIAGFPGEDEHAFFRTLELVEEARPDIINMKAFSPRPGTPAFKLGPRADRNEVRSRLRRLTALKRQLSLGNNRRFVGRLEKVLVAERARKGAFLGRTEGYYPVLLPCAEPGTFIDVRILEARAGYLVGERA